ncbi:MULTISPECIES: PDR/VanB family oxidoreductase [unclassified Maritimibacter]|jgi:phthalate 4,5-dioxygenase reductase subunit|uniref:PDR/VanB family oxidoreductase n=1 Tax=unclassified Maritimibacter TaxID=2635563 RepID=UPI000C093238|nr:MULTISPECIES: PDR/VanB family oxidoreductase [unclassified Maritimibacter]MAM61386.1 ferredoxin [Maritimibacter sp.]MBL6430282.1 oxidoreductase [Maritimibacter sp.]|tara:strand:- start:755 stop:1693 length:939 start_codon:yes stop_codon:yes gene_type:complete
MTDLTMRVEARRPLTEQICEFTLAPLDGAELPTFEPGAHVTIETPSKAMRRYSLINDGSAPEVYKIAVKREPESRGGSASMHDEATVGTELRVEPPENDFPMGEANEYLLIAGGIGVTPIYSMAQQLDREGKPFNIIYCTRSPEDTAYLDEMRAAFGDRLLVHHDEGDPEKVYDFWDHFEEPKNMHVYCCGPAPLMEEIEAISGHWPEGRVNFEDFKPVDVVREDDKAFDVVLEKSGKRVTVPEDRSILEALRDAGVATVSSCESGTCGTCKTRLLSGEVDHRDMVLMDEEKSENIMICVSRAKEGELVLDL